MKVKFITIIVAFVVLIGCGSSPSTSGSDELDLAIRDASDYLNDNIPEKSMIVILNIQSDSKPLSEYIIDELIANAVNDKIFKVVDRQQLDLIRSEQNFQLSGEVDDNLALSIGKFFGAQTIVSGKFSQVGERYRMTIRALEVQTAQVQGQYNRNIAAGKTITELMGSSGGSSKGTQATPAKTTGNGGSGTATTSGTSAKIVPTVTKVTISPDNLSITKGETRQFSAIVTGTNNPDQIVTWIVTGNTSSETNINEDGILTIAEDENITSLTITATSSIDRSKNGKTTVRIIVPVNVNNVSTWNTAVNTIRNGGNNQAYIINITDNVSVPAVDENIFGSVTGLTLTIQGNSTISLSVSGSLLRIAAGQTIIVRDVILRGRSDNNSPVISIMSGGILRMEGNALVTGNTNRSFDGWGGGVLVGGGTFIMQDKSSVIGNTDSSDAWGSGSNSGGGVFVRSGTFIMQNGTVSGNTAGWSGGVHIASGATFTMENGTISGNNARGYNGSSGGGVSVKGTFTMQGGFIIGNTANGFNGGGGVHVDGGIFTMQGGTISGGNNTSNNGGGVSVNNGTFTKTGGTISGSDAALSDRNTATKQGHAVYWNSDPARWRNATAGPDDKTAGYGFWMND